ncbi:MAG: cupin domain-containing protein [Thermoleophilia bacterium]|jgi:mannose-6-phosphate isomerase-like protein (cupin superfamily)
MAAPEATNFADATDIREFPHGRAEIVELGGGEIARLTLAPGWKWSEHVKPMAETDSCQVAHFQYIVSGRVVVEMDDGAQVELGPGDVGLVPPGHDAWVVGEEECVAIDWGGIHT